MAIRMTSKGIATINLPFKLNIKIMVNNKAIKVIGLMAGINFVVYHSSPFNFTKNFLDKNPAANGKPK